MAVSPDCIFGASVVSARQAQVLLAVEEGLPSLQLGLVQAFGAQQALFNLPQLF
jgi:hypothetical protein